MEEEIISGGWDEKVEGGRETGLSGSGWGGGDGKLNWQKRRRLRVIVVYRERGFAWSLKLGTQREIRPGREGGGGKKERDDGGTGGANKETVWLPSDPDDERAVHYTCGQYPYIHWRMAARGCPLLSLDGASSPSKKLCAAMIFWIPDPPSLSFSIFFLFLTIWSDSRWACRLSIRKCLFTCKNLYM